MLDLRKKIFPELLKKNRDFFTMLEQFQKKNQIFKFSKIKTPYFPIFLIMG